MFYVAEGVHAVSAHVFFFFFYLNNSIAELQGVEKLDEGRHPDPVLSVQAVPLLAGNLQLGRQRGVEAAQPCGEHLSRG